MERLEHWNGLFSCFMEPLERMERLELLARNHWLLSNQELASVGPGTSVRAKILYPWAAPHYPAGTNFLMARGYGME